MSSLPSNASTSSEAYRSFGQLHPSVFGDAAETERVAKGAFAEWIQQASIVPANPMTLIRDVRVERSYWGRLESEIAARATGWREEAHTGGPQAAGAPPLAANVDPWATTAEEIRQVSRQICRCEPCEGSGRVACQVCDGKGQQQCANCQGTGKAYGYAKNGSRRLMNCRACMGQLELQCSSCESGRRQCSSCLGSGQKVRWLEMLETKRIDVRVALEGQLPEAFPWKDAASSASQSEICADVGIAGKTGTDGVLSKTESAKLGPPEWIDQHWPELQPALASDERVVRQSLFLFEAPSVTVTYALPAGERSIVRFEGLRLLAPPVTCDKSLASRASTLRLCRNVLVGVALGIPLAYVARSEYFRSASVALLSACLVMEAFAVYRFMREFLFDGLARARGWAWLAGFGILIIGGLAFLSEPSPRAARQYLSKDRLDAAREELLALGDPTVPEREELWASLHLAFAKRATDPDVVRRELTQIAPRLPQRAACAHRLRELVDAVARAHLASGQRQGAEALLAVVAPILNEELAGDPALGQLSQLCAVVQDKAFEQCASEVCRLNTARRALSYATSPTRVQRLTLTRGRILASLAYRSSRDEPVLTRLKKLRDIQVLVSELGDVVGDHELATQARAASENVHRGRGEVPLIGSDAAVLEELLGQATSRGASVLRFDGDSVSLYASMRGGRCVGTYIVGRSKEQRGLNEPGRLKTASLLLSQSFGRELPFPAQSAGTNRRTSISSSTLMAGVPLVARWNGSALTELRVGEARP